MVQILCIDIFGTRVVRAVVIEIWARGAMRIWKGDENRILWLWYEIFIWKNFIFEGYLFEEIYLEGVYSKELYVNDLYLKDLFNWLYLCFLIRLSNNYGVLAALLFISLVDYCCYHCYLSFYYFLYAILHRLFD